MSKKDNNVMAALNELEDACRCSNTKDKYANLITRFKVLPDGFNYTVLCNNSSKYWYVCNNEDNNNWAIPFGEMVADVVNFYFSLNPLSVLYQSPDINISATVEPKKLYSENKEDIEYLIKYLTNIKDFNLQDNFSVWNVYRNFFAFNEKWHLVKKCRGSSVHAYALKLLSNYAHKHICQDKSLLDIGGKIESVSTYSMDSLVHLFEFDLYKVLVDGSCGIFHICQHCEKAYFDNDSKTKYCPDCRKNQKQILAQNRKSNKARYLHKRIQDKLKQQKKDTSDFSVESNYYWSLCQNKKPKTGRLENYENITSEESYMAWLEKKFEELKVQK